MSFLLFLCFLAFFYFFNLMLNLLIKPLSRHELKRINQVKHLGLVQEEWAVYNHPLLLRLYQPILDIISKPWLEALNFHVAASDLEKASTTLSPQQFTVLRLTLATATGFFWTILSIIKQQTTTTFLGLTLTLLVFYLPAIMLKLKIKSQQEKILKEFPDFIDATRTYLSSGLSIYQAIKNSVEISGPSLKPLLAKLSAEMEVYDHITALRKFSERTGALEIQNFIITIEQSLTSGIPLRDTFVSQSQLIRELRKLSLKKMIKQKPAYMAIVGGLLFINIFIIVGLPAAYSILALRGLR